MPRTRSGSLGLEWGLINAQVIVMHSQASGSTLLRSSRMPEEWEGRRVLPVGGRGLESGSSPPAPLWGSGLSLCWVPDSLLQWDRCIHSSPTRNPRPEAVAAVLWSTRLAEWQGQTRGTGSVTAERDSTARGCPAVGLRVAARPGGRDAGKVAGNREGQTAPASQLGIWSGAPEAGEGPRGTRRGR